MKTIFGILLALILLLSFNISCHDQIVRDKNTYIAEVNLMEQFSVQQANLLAEFIQLNCRCEDNRFIDDQCTRAANTVLLVRKRIQWHKDMMLFNGGITDLRPTTTPPLVPPAQELCP